MRPSFKRVMPKRFTAWYGRRKARAELRKRASLSISLIPEKTISAKAIAAFWLKYDSDPRSVARTQPNWLGEMVPGPNKHPLRIARERTRKPYFDQTSTRMRQPFRVSASALGVVRPFHNNNDLLAYLNQVNQVNQLAQKQSFKSFVLQPTQIFGVDEKNNRVLERVYRAPSIEQLEDSNPSNNFNSLYGAHFWRRMQRKKVLLEELRQSIAKAMNEIKFGIGRQYDLDAWPNNFLVLDYDPRTKKPLIAVVDHYTRGIRAPGI